MDEERGERVIGRKEGVITGRGDDLETGRVDN